MLPRNEVALFDRAFFRKTPEAFQEELLPFPSAQPANRFTMSSQFLFSFARPRAEALFYSASVVGLEPHAST
jgi:hypothetical protein